MKTTDVNEKCVIIGDMNTRFGKSARDLANQAQLTDCDFYSYPVLPDEVNVPNENALVFVRYF